MITSYTISSKSWQRVDVYLVFDRYNEYSIKDAARCCREQTGSKKYKLRPDTTLPKKTIVLTVTTNKVQLIDVICQQLCVKIQNLPLSEEGTMHKFVLTGKDPSPVEISQGYLSVLDECATTHEEDDVVIVQQMVHIAVAKQGQCVIKIICDDTDVYLLLLHHYYYSGLDCTVLMEGTSTDHTIYNIRDTVQAHEHMST